MKVNEKIKHLRQNQGLSQEEIAKQLDMSANGYGGIERGEVDIKLSRLEQLSELFGVELNELLNLSDYAVFNLITDTATQNAGTLNHFNINSESSENVQLKHDLEKSQLIIEKLEAKVASQQSEIVYLKEIIELMKSKS